MPPPLHFDRRPRARVRGQPSAYVGEPDVSGGGAAAPQALAPDVEAVELPVHDGVTQAEVGAVVARLRQIEVEEAAAEGDDVRGLPDGVVRGGLSHVLDIVPDQDVVPVSVHGGASFRVRGGVYGGSTAARGCAPHGCRGLAGSPARPFTGEAPGPRARARPRRIGSGCGSSSRGRVPVVRFSGRAAPGGPVGAIPRNGRWSDHRRRRASSSAAVLGRARPCSRSPDLSMKEGCRTETACPPAPAVRRGGGEAESPHGAGSR